MKAALLEKTFIYGLRMTDRGYLADMHMFVAVARAKSFTRASAAVNIPTSTLSRRIAELERALGVRLLNRTTTQMELTDDGARYLIDAQRIVDDAQAVHDGIRARLGRLSGILRVAMPQSVASHLAIPWLAEFSNIHSELEIEVDTSPDHIDLIADNLDLCIYDHEMRDSSLITRHLASYSRSLFASAQYIAQFGSPTHPCELTSHRCIWLGPRDAGKGVWTLFRGSDRVQVKISGGIASINPDLGWALALEGVGIAPVVTQSFAISGLVPVLPDWQFQPLTLYAVMASKPVPPKVRAFVDFIVDKLELDQSGRQGD